MLRALKVFIHAVWVSCFAIVVVIVFPVTSITVGTLIFNSVLVDDTGLSFLLSFLLFMVTAVGLMAVIKDQPDIATKAAKFLRLRS